MRFLDRIDKKQSVKLSELVAINPSFLETPNSYLADFMVQTRINLSELLTQEKKVIKFLNVYVDNERALEDLDNIYNGLDFAIQKSPDYEDWDRFKLLYPSNNNDMLDRYKDVNVPFEIYSVLVKINKQVTDNTPEQMWAAGSSL